MSAGNASSSTVSLDTGTAPEVPNGHSAAKSAPVSTSYRAAQYIECTLGPTESDGVDGPPKKVHVEVIVPWYLMALTPSSPGGGLTRSAAVFVTGVPCVPSPPLTNLIASTASSSAPMSSLAPPPGDWASMHHCRTAAIAKYYLK